MTITTDRERQRFDFLVLARPRPKLPRTRKRGRGGAKAGIVLAEGIEERVQLRERWSHKQGTPETHEHADRERRRPGSLARLYETGTINADQLAAADQIAEAYRAIIAGVAVRTASLEARIDAGAHGRAEGQALGAIWSDLAYDWWRSRVGSSGEALLSIIVHDTGLTIVARRHGLSMPKARRMLTAALDLWWVCRGTTKREARLAFAADQT